MKPNPLDLDLPKRLAAPGGEALRNELHQSLQMAQAQLQAIVRTGAGPAEFADATVLLDAVTAAREVLDAGACGTHP